MSRRRLQRFDPSEIPASLLRRLRDLLGKDGLEREMDEELAFHLERETEENLRRGMGPEEARLRARRSLGLPERIKEDCRRVHGFTRLETLWRDLLYALRGLRRQPGFTAAAVATLALGIGATTGLFSVVRGVLLRPLPFPEPDELVQILGHDRREGIGRGTISYPNFVDVRRRAESFASMAVYDEWTVLLDREEGAVRMPGASVSASFFDVLGVTPAAGRFFLPEEDEPRSDRGGARVVVLSHGLWSRHFGGDPGVVGRSVTLNGLGYRVIGVAPASLEDPGLSGASFAAPELWRAPPGYFASDIARDGRSLTAIARLKDGVSPQAARIELDVLMRDLERAHPEENAHATMTAVPLEDRIVGDVRRPLVLLLAASGLVLLIACANVANLLLARSERRSGELAVRAMVGASRGRILRQLAVESLTLATVGAGLGLGVALAGIRLLTAVGAEEIPRWAEVRLDGAVLSFVAGTAVLTAVVFGLAPALRVLRTDLNAMIDRSRRGGTFRGGSEGSGLSRKVLIGGEVALSVVLLVGSLLLLQSLATLRGVDPGIEAERLLTAELTTPRGRYDGPSAALALYDRLTERLAALPGAESAASINILPMSGSFDGQAFRIEDRPEPAPGDEPRAEVRAVTPGFFDTAGIRVLQGRSLEGAGGSRSFAAVVVNRAAAERFWPGESPVGHRVDLRGEVREVVGVVGDIRQFALDRPPEPAIYLPQAQAPRWMWVDSTVLVRTANEPDELAGALRGVIRELDPRIAVTDVLPMDRVIGGTLEQARFRTVLLTVFAIVALILGVVGLYGVVAYATAGRSRELGIRMALGAQRHRVLTLVMREGLVPAAAGAVVGLAAALALATAAAGLLGDLLYRVDPGDPLIHAGATLALLLTAALACFLPARRATRTDPVETLRA